MFRLLMVMCRQVVPCLDGLFCASKKQIDVPQSSRASFTRCFFACLIIGVSLSFKDVSPCCADDLETLQANALAILKKHCSSCHDASYEERDEDAYTGDFTFVANPEQLIHSKMNLVIPGSLGDSKLYLRINDGTMPPSGEITDAEIKTIGKWIKVLENSEREIVREHISLAEELKTANRFVRSKPEYEREFIRFFSLRNAFNNPNVGAKDLEFQRLGLAKTLNGLSWKRKLLLLKPADKHGALYAFDVRDAEWDRSDWIEILKRYPYALKYDTSPADEAVNNAAIDLYEATGTEVPIIRIDWFVTHANRPELYHSLLNLPTNEIELERRLGVNANRNILQGSVIREGMLKSGVSAQNRLIERHEGNFGFYWKSYDFLPLQESSKSDLIRLPLGPAFPSNPYDNFAFEHDGGELIFQLPNGLQAYMLVDARGHRIDAGPQKVVEDKVGRFSGSSIILNGISCIGCHADGMRYSDRGDDLRDGTALRGEALRMLRRLHPGNDAVMKSLDSDRDDYRDSVIRVFESIVGDNPLVKLRSERGAPVEPVTKVAKPFFNGPIDIIDIVADLDFENEDRLSGAISANQDLRRLGLGPIANGAVMRRSHWEFRGALTTRFQQAAGILDRGTAVVFGF